MMMHQETPQFVAMPAGAGGGVHQQQLVYVFNSEAGQWQPVLTTTNEPVFFVAPEEMSNLQPVAHAVAAAITRESETVSEQQPFLMEEDEEEGRGNHKVFKTGTRPHKDTLLWLAWYCNTLLFSSFRNPFRVYSST